MIYCLYTYSFHTAVYKNKSKTREHHNTLLTPKIHLRMMMQQHKQHLTNSKKVQAVVHQIPQTHIHKGLTFKHVWKVWGHWGNKHQLCSHFDNLLMIFVNIFLTFLHSDEVSSLDMLKSSSSALSGIINAFPIHRGRDKKHSAF